MGVTMVTMLDNGIGRGIGGTKAAKFTKIRQSEMDKTILGFAS